MLRVYLLTVAFTLPLTIFGRPGFKCSSSEFECSLSQTCIPTSWKCDGDKDCVNGADENQCDALVTCGTGFYKCRNGRCIDPSWVCDGHADCPAKDDEAPIQTCNRTTCSSDAFQCQDGTCIQGSYKCDYEDDCDDKSDEADCPAIVCTADQFRCGNNRTCIASNLKCNGANDCNDGSDEKGCPALCVEAVHFTCASRECIPKAWHCDGDNDCIDHSDEQSCPTPPTDVTCSSDNFRCGDGECIALGWKCDNAADCADGSDESGCPTPVTCSASQFTCAASGKCIAKTSKCNHITDCSDGSDEAGCDSTDSPCVKGEFRCGTSSVCLNMTRVCNGLRECPGGDDEAQNCGINECSDHNGHCHHTCNDLPIGYKCSCNPGYKLANDSRACEDINECKEIYGICSQTCVNNKGSYKCGCVDGYIDEITMDTCRATGPSSYLVFGDQHSVRNITTSGSEYGIIVSNRKAPTAVDYHLETGFVYWTDILDGKIERTRLLSDGNVERVLDGVKHSNGLAVDWVGKKLYWTDETAKSIEVSELNGQNRLKLFSVSVDSPRGIAVDPFERYVFWTDWGSIHPKIERASMDGESVTRRIIVDTDIMWPIALTLDTILQRVYFADTKMQKIETCKYDGSSRTKLISSGVVHPLGLTVFEDYLYYTDYSLNKMFSVNKRTGHNHGELASDLQRPAGIQVVHPLKQKEVSTKCSENNGGCTHLCLLSRNAQKYSCRCPAGMRLRGDGISCVYIGKGNDTTSKPPVNTDKTTRPPVNTDTTSKRPVNTDTTTGHNGTGDDVPLASKSKRSSSNSGPMIAGVTVAVVVAIFAVIVIVLFLRKRTNYHGRSILFYKDNSRTPLENDFDEDPLKSPEEEIGSRSRVQFT